MDESEICRSEIEVLLKEAVRQCLSSGAEPSEVSFVMAAISTELGLHITGNDLSVIPVVLSGIARAIQESSERDNTDEESEAEYETSRGQVIH
jgi:hypothetical protein